MRKLSRIFRGSFFLLLTLAFTVLVCIPVSTSAANEIVAVVHKNQEISQLSYQDLGRIYEGKKKVWGNGENIVLLLPPSKSKSMELLVKKVLRKNNEAEVSGFYLQAVFQQVFVNPPISFSNAHFTLAAVQGTLGAIAIMDLEEVPPDSDVRVVHLRE